ncbi:MAG TPA: FAD-dependent oxidoreductase [Bryobacteraceae bacterium]|jgi:NADPH-dependent 2,4-dienoyl-CoA reductase/sulfur reductase-like enzyme|nr:FAD-dependent oxidoreductase [Bryobacteraceae bacterium]
MRVAIIGGSDAGISAALRVHEFNPSAHISVMLADAFPNFSICGLPFYLSGETPDWKQLAHRTEFDGIEVLRNHRASHIDAANGFVLARHEEKTKAVPYDQLIIGTGAVPVRPPIDGLNESGVFLLHTMEDSFRIHDYLTRESPKSALIIGAGYIGVELADALTHRGLAVTLPSRPGTVLPSVDPDFGELIGRELQDRGVELWTGVQVERIESFNGQLKAHSSLGEERTADLVIVATGVKPDSELARGAGVEIGEHGAIRVSRRMETNVPGIYAAGDCVETWHRIRDAYAYLPLGTTSHKQGRVAGENAAGGEAVFAGVVGTQVVKVFEVAIARTGLLDCEARQAGFDAFTAQTEMWDHKAYYPGARKLCVRITGDRSSGRLLGAQILGHWKAEISKRIDVLATALYHEMTVEALNELDLSYTPPLSSPWDPVQMSAQAWCHAIRTQRSSEEIVNV